ncbi:MAG: hypothetical protein QM817_28000 [Archangium sp.]
MRIPILFTLLVAGAASAETKWGLRWRAPDECISAADLAARVEKRLGRPVFGLNPDFRVDGLMEKQATSPKWRARITVVSAAGDVAGSREVTGDDDSCHALDDRIAFVVSVSIDPNLQAPVDPPPAPPVVAQRSPSPEVPQPKRAPPSADSVFVEVETDDPDVTLFRHVGTSFGANIVVTTIEKECEAPCGVFVDKPRSDFFVSGRGITISETFSLTKFPDGLKLKVRPGSSTLRWFGWTLAVLGASAALCGGLFAGLSAIGQPSTPGVQNPYGGTGSVFGSIGIGMLIGGGAGLAAGIPMIAFSGTKLEFFPIHAPPAAVTPNPVQEI